MQYFKGKEKLNIVFGLLYLLVLLYCSLLIPKIPCPPQNTPHNIASFPKAKFSYSPQQVFEKLYPPINTSSWDEKCLTLIFLYTTKTLLFV